MVSKRSSCPEVEFYLKFTKQNICLKVFAFPVLYFTHVFHKDDTDSIYFTFVLEKLSHVLIFKR